jgi:hypothetical protein
MPAIPKGIRAVSAITGCGAGAPGRNQVRRDDGDLALGSGQFGLVPPEVWAYDVGIMQIVKKWLGYRKAKPNRRKTSPLDDIHAESWPAEWSSELMELLSVLRRLRCCPSRSAWLAPTAKPPQLRSAPPRRVA